MEKLKIFFDFENFVLIKKLQNLIFALLQFPRLVRSHLLHQSSGGPDIMIRPKWWLLSSSCGGYSLLNISYIIFSQGFAQDPMISNPMF